MLECPECHLTQLPEPSGAQAICMRCGVVLEESQIVSDVTFAENSAGGAVVQGSYVGNDQRGARTQGPGGYRNGHAGASREQTLQNANRAIRALGLSKGVSQLVIEKAQRMFKLAIEGGTYMNEPGDPHNYVLGRRAEYTQASCLYVACRMARTSHMLIDFADAIGVNVFVLGRSYLRMVRCLSLAKHLPVIDPSIYISRFASLLDFGDETRKVALDATRLVNRFNKDWITEGRRPAGVCGACLLLAARMNNFRRSIAEVIQVVKIADVTLRKRLDEFKETASSKLSIDEFRNIWLEEEKEPPAFYISERLLEGKNAKGDRVRKRAKAGGAMTVDEDEDEDGNEADDEGQKQAKTVIDPALDQIADEATRAEINEYLNEEVARQLHDNAVPSQAQANGSNVKLDHSPNGGEEVDDLADLDEEELDAFINTEAEVKIKERVWIEFNKDYLERMLEKHLKMEADIKAGIKPAPVRKKRSNKPRDSSTAPSTAAESATQMMRKRNFSKRLNYDAIQSLLDEKPSMKMKDKKRRSRSDDEEEAEVNDQMMNGIPAPPQRASYFASDDDNDDDEDDEEIIDGDAEDARAKDVRKQRKAERRSGHDDGDESATDRAMSHFTDGETDGDEASDWRKGLPAYMRPTSGAEDDVDNPYEDEY